MLFSLHIHSGLVLVVFPIRRCDERDIECIDDRSMKVFRMSTKCPKDCNQSSFLPICVNYDVLHIFTIYYNP